MKDYTLIRQVVKYELALSALNEGYKNGEITLKQLVDGEEEIGRQYSRWAEYQDKTDAGNYYKREMPTGLKLPGGR